MQLRAGLEHRDRAKLGGYTEGCGCPSDRHPWKGAEGGSGHDLEGQCDWSCTSGRPCSGTDLFNGTVSESGSMMLSGFELIDPKEIGLRDYVATVAPDDSSISGTWDGGPGPNSFTLSRPIPEPSTALLVAAGLIGLGVARR